MRGKNLLKYVLPMTFAVGTPQYFSGGSLEAKNSMTREYKEVLRDEKNTLDLEKILGNDSIPALAKFRLEPNNCAGYARRVADKYWNKKFHERDSWNFRYYDQVVSKINKKEDVYKQLDSLSMEGILQPGMIIGAEYPGWRNKFANEGIKDERGKFPAYPHTMVYVGRKDGKVVIHQQWGPRIEEIDIEGLKQKKIIPVEILDSILDKLYASQQDNHGERNRV